MGPTVAACEHLPHTRESGRGAGSSRQHWFERAGKGVAPLCRQAVAILRAAPNQPGIHPIRFGDEPPVERLGELREHVDR